MYPQRELIRLAAHKAALRRDIARHRVACAEAATALARPLAWLERALGFAQRLASLALCASVPLGFLVARTVFPRRKFLGSLTRWVPLVFAAVRRLRSVRNARTRS